MNFLEYRKFFNQNAGLKFYAGIGCRNINVTYFRIMTRIGVMLAFYGRCLNSGAASGSDEAFELGVDLFLDLLKKESKKDGVDFDYSFYVNKLKNIFIPWNGFRGRFDGKDGAIFHKYDPLATETRALTHKYHPNKKLSGIAANMMDRNARQALGDDLNTFAGSIVCYTPDGALSGKETTYKTGGTGQAIRIASDHDISVINIGNKGIKQEWLERLDTFDKKFMSLFNTTTKELVDGYLDNYALFSLIDDPDNFEQSPYVFNPGHDSYAEINYEKIRKELKIIDQNASANDLVIVLDDLHDMEWFVLARIIKETIKHHKVSVCKK